MIPDTEPSPPKTAKILIATPVFARGADPRSALVTYGWAALLPQLSRDPNIDIRVLGFGCDLVRSRSRIVRMALETGEFTHVLWWDEDVVPDDVAIIRSMLETGHDLVAAPYPTKLIDWGGVATAAHHGKHPEAGAYRYPFHRNDRGLEAKAHNACVDVDHIAMGFMLTSTAMLSKMWDTYAPTLSFGDLVDGDKHWTVALFQLTGPKQSPVPPYSIGPLWSEDYSFCARAADCGYQPMMYCGQGSPVNHAGSMLFKGHREGLVR
jgi:hypothetical protein